MFETPKILTEWARDHAILGPLALGGWFVIQRMGIPYVARVLAARKLERQAGEQERLSVLKDIRDELRTLKPMQDRLSKLETICSALLQDESGVVGKDRAVRNFASQMDKLFTKAYTHYLLRLEANHIHSMPDVVAARYTHFASVQGTQAMSMLTDDNLHGIRPLSEFWGKHGAEGFFKHLNHDFYCAQFILSDPTEKLSPLSQQLKNLTVQDYQDALDRLLFAVIDAFRAWLDDPEQVFGCQKIANPALFRLELVGNVDIEGSHIGGSGDICQEKE